MAADAPKLVDNDEAVHAKVRSVSSNAVDAVSRQAVNDVVARTTVRAVNVALPSFAPTESVARKVANVGASSDVVRINSAAAFAAKVSRSAGNVAAANCAAASCAESSYAAASFEDNSCAASRNAVDSSFAARG